MGVVRGARCRSAAFRGRRIAPLRPSTGTRAVKAPPMSIPERTLTWPAPPGPFPRNLVLGTRDSSTIALVGPSPLTGQHLAASFRQHTMTDDQPKHRRPRFWIILVAIIIAVDLPVLLQAVPGLPLHRDSQRPFQQRPVLVRLPRGSRRLRRGALGSRSGRTCSVPSRSSTSRDSSTIPSRSRSLQASSSWPAPTLAVGPDARRAPDERRAGARRRIRPAPRLDRDARHPHHPVLPPAPAHPRVPARVASPAGRGRRRGTVRGRRLGKSGRRALASAGNVHGAIHRGQSMHKPGLVALRPESIVLAGL